ncbi:unnamed protein product [Citrullus colocynthis]|uniref:Uncharacterized protein n=1 Tax=Citrullus colocynthis TaxID=252529 RepID=A0ABP0Z6N1_9ROSI
MTKPQMNLRFSGRRLLLLLSLITCFSSEFCYGDTITSADFIKYPATKISNATSFELGWFSPLNSTAQYVGIWFHQVSIQTIVWVANKDTPLNNTSGIFTISNDGNLVILDENNTIIWSSNVTSPTVNTTARILDSGNLVLEDPASGLVIWESFKHPSNIFLPSMELITNKRTQDKLEFTSWKTPSDPSTGNFSLALDVVNIPEAVIWNNGGNPYWRSGPWNGHTFIGIPEMISVYLIGFNLAIEDQIYYFSITYNNDNQLLYTMVLSPEGNLEQQYWNSSKKNWEARWLAFRTECDYYGVCGAFGVCNANASPVCSCLTGFKPRDEKEWNRGNWSNGCVRNTALQCEKPNNATTSGEEDGFLEVELVKVPFLAEWSNFSTSADDCKQECFENCLCSAYAYENGIGCMLWKRDLIDVQKFESLGSNLHLRLAHADLQTINDVKSKSTGIIIAIVLPATLMIFIIAIYFWWRWKASKNEHSKKGGRLKLRSDDMIGDQSKFEELPLYDFEKLAIATNSFDLSQKLGQGGFGPVYKGRLLNGQEIAIKRLSRASKQGYEEFINEVIVISKLQHRNLVQLLGCCIEGEEKMLIYEYMPNLSLDAFIFDSTKQKLLDWRKRFNIVDGIARGLLYLHRDSRLKIIHRDLKASNILLDKDMNPKISDFGMARIFGNNEVEANTIRVVGTYGYMSPEYAMQGQFSEKSDVFSFGVLLLEIISGKRNTGFNRHEHALSLLEFAWKLWIEDNLIALIDPTMHELCYQSEILRCIQIGLLCVEESINDRPNVLAIISMLNSEIVDLPIPKQPSFIGRPTQSSVLKQMHSIPFPKQCDSDTITSTDFIKYPATKISNATSFELGWFSPLNSTAQYVGIWFHQVSIQTIVWVANKDTPLNNTSGIFTISNDGNLVILDENNTIIWSSNVTSPTVNTTARILDSGNLVLEDPASGLVIWESFKHPSNIFLPSMELITNKRTQDKLEFTSWKTPSDPSTGNFSLALDVVNIPEAVIWNNGGNPYWRSGPWNGHTFIGIPEMISVYLIGFNLAIEDQIYYFSITYNNDNQLLYTMVLSPEGNLEQQYWNSSKKNWVGTWSALKTQCDYYGFCGAFGLCNSLQLFNRV